MVQYDNNIWEIVDFRHLPCFHTKTLSIRGYLFVLVDYLLYRWRSSQQPIVWYSVTVSGNCMHFNQEKNYMKQGSWKTKP